MTKLYFVTSIQAPRPSVFDLARDMDLHMQSAAATSEYIVAGRRSGLLEQGETVSFEGRHFGIRFRHTSVMAELSTYDYFIDEMTHGRFRFFRHEHRFYEEGGGTRMEDVLLYEVPYGWVGQLFDRLFLRRHLETFIERRNEYLKKVAERGTFEKRVSC